MLSLTRKTINKALLDNFTQKQNVAMLAFRTIIKEHKKNKIVADQHDDDVKMVLELFLYDIQSVHTLMKENIRYFERALEKTESDILPTTQQKREGAYVEEYLQNQNVAMLAFSKLEQGEWEWALEASHPKVLKIRAEKILYNLESICQNMETNMGNLWIIKDKIATTREEMGISPIFAFDSGAYFDGTYHSN